MLLLLLGRLLLVEAVLVTGLFEVHLSPGVEECAGATSQKLGVFVELVLALEVIHMQELTRKQFVVFLVEEFVKSVAVLMREGYVGEMERLLEGLEDLVHEAAVLLQLQLEGTFRLPPLQLGKLI